MRVILTVADKEQINATGDVLILGNVGDRSQITITDGSLIIMGKVGIFTNIKVISTDSYKEALEKSQSNTKVRPNISSNLTQSENVYLQNVNADNRIFTDNALTYLGNDIFEITSINEVLHGEKFVAKARIDGKEYQGYKILIIGNAVIVDGELKHSASILIPRVEIRGRVGEHTEITSALVLHAQEYGEKCILTGPNISSKPYPDHIGLIKNGLFTEAGANTTSVPRQIRYNPLEVHGWYTIGNSKCFTLYANLRNNSIAKIMLHIEQIAGEKIEVVQDLMRRYSKDISRNQYRINQDKQIVELIMHLLDANALVEELNTLGNIYSEKSFVALTCANLF